MAAAGAAYIAGSGAVASVFRRPAIVEHSGGPSGRLGCMQYRVYLEQDEDGIFVATCPVLPGCVSQGRTRSEATENIREAIEGYLETLRKHGEPALDAEKRAVD